MVRYVYSHEVNAFSQRDASCMFISLYGQSIDQPQQSSGTQKLTLDDSVVFLHAAKCPYSSVLQWMTMFMLPWARLGLEEYKSSKILPAQLTEIDKYYHSPSLAVFPHIRICSNL